MTHKLYSPIYMFKSRFILLTMKKPCAEEEQLSGQPWAGLPHAEGLLVQAQWLHASSSTLGVPVFSSSGWVTCSFISSISHVLPSKGVPGSVFEAPVGACLFFAKQVWWLMLHCIPHTVPNLLSQTFYWHVFHKFFHVRKQIHGKNKSFVPSATWDWGIQSSRIQPSRRSITWQRRKRWDINQELVPFTGGRDWISSSPGRRASKRVSPQ